MNTKHIATWTFLALLLPALAGCIEAAVVGIGAGAMMATDRRPSDTYLTDQVIELRAGNGIGEKYPNTVHVNITAHPTAEWVWRQLLAATPWTQQAPVTAS